HAQVLDRPCPLRDDRRPGAMELHLDHGGHTLHLLRRQRVERRVLSEKPRDFRRGRRRGAQAIAGGATGSAGISVSRLIRTAHFSPTIIVVMQGLIAGRNGRIEPSATRRALTPRTRSCGSTTAVGSESGPM